MSLLKRIRALDKSAEFSPRYTALVLFHPRGVTTAAAPGDARSSYVAVGHAETSRIASLLLRCEDVDGAPTFVVERWPNERGVVTEVLRLRMDAQIQKEWTATNSGLNESGITEHFRERTAAFERATDCLISAGVISRRHDDVYPIRPLAGGGDREEGAVLAHVNRNAAPYLGVNSVGVHLHCYVSRRECAGRVDGTRDLAAPPRVEGVWMAKRAASKAHHPNYWDPTVAGGQPANLSLIENVVKEAGEEAGVPAEWISHNSTLKELGDAATTAATTAPTTLFSDHTYDPLTITTAKPDGTCLKNSIYYSCDLRVPHDWTPTPVDGEVAEFRLYSMEELEEELRHGSSVRPAMRAVLLDFMLRHGEWKAGEDNIHELRDAMRRERLILWP